LKYANYLSGNPACLFYLITDWRPIVFRRIWIVLTFSLVAIVALAACNGDDDNGDDGANGNGDSVSMSMGEFYFDPDDIEGPAGGQLTIDLENTGSQVHNFTILEGEPRGDGFDAWPNSEVELELAEGDSDSITISLPDEAGEYEFICTVPGHYESGQWGTLTVTD
jgi:plastocyanin